MASFSLVTNFRVDFNDVVSRLFVNVPQGHFLASEAATWKLQKSFLSVSLSQNILIAYDAVLGLNCSRVLKTFSSCLFSSQINYL